LPSNIARKSGASCPRGAPESGNFNKRSQAPAILASRREAVASEASEAT
jgi:hypothetical protein